MGLYEKIKSAGSTAKDVAVGATTKTADYVVDKAGTIAGFGLGSQIPAFFDDYRQRVGGAAGEAGKSLGQFQDDADKYFGGSLDKLIEHYKGNTSDVIQDGGENIGFLQERFNELQSAYDTLKNSSILEKPMEYWNAVDMDLVKQTLNDFVPSIPLSPEGLAFGVAGVLAVGAGYKLTKAGVGGLYNAIKNKICGKPEPATL